jgi:hypothetical protein
MRNTKRCREKRQRQRQNRKQEFPNVLDLTGKLSYFQYKVLSRGLGFVPASLSRKPPELFWGPFMRNVQRKVEPAPPAWRAPSEMTLEKFHMPDESDPKDEFVKFKPQNAQMEDFLKNTGKVLMKKNAESSRTPNKDNLSKNERHALQELREDHSIVIKPADKGDTIVIMPRDLYIQQGLEHMNDREAYLPIHQSLRGQNSQRQEAILKCMVEQRQITAKLASQLSGETRDKDREIYFLPKAHKPKPWPSKLPPFRPILPNVGTEFSATSLLLTHYLKRCLPRVKSLIKNSDDFLVRLEQLLQTSDPDMLEKVILVTADIDKCYPTIPQMEAVLCARDCLDSVWEPGIPDTNLLRDLLELQMCNNDVFFNGKYYKQIRGIAMGQSWAPPICNLYFDQYDKWVLTHKNVLFYVRFIDDTFMLWTGNETELVCFQAAANNWRPGVIKLEFLSSRTSLNFLDMTLFTDFSSRRIIMSKPYFKATDSHQLLHFGSNHPSHTFGGILKSTAIRITKLSTREKDCVDALESIKLALRIRGYPEQLLARYLKPCRSNTSDPSVVVPLVVDYDPRITENMRWTQEKWKEFLNIFPQYKANLPSKVTTAWRAKKSLRKLLVNKDTRQTEEILGE